MLSWLVALTHSLYMTVSARGLLGTWQLWLIDCFNNFAGRTGQRSGIIRHIRHMQENSSVSQAHGNKNIQHGWLICLTFFPPESTPDWETSAVQDFWRNNAVGRDRQLLLSNTNKKYIFYNWREEKNTTNKCFVLQKMFVLI